ncbi:hypothetical protein VSX61_05340 [Brenneria populi subsp. brevivirga]|uniref:hypothetical protein n=1 Tax=Brenneria populi TaxID=1505588 RepID=UPI002E183D5F|nr:hypothetical protein [Brenneria populi subsp. brevivirga]
MKPLVSCCLSLLLCTSVWSQAQGEMTVPQLPDTGEGIFPLLKGKSLAIFGGTFIDTGMGCNCVYIVKNLRSSPLERFIAHIEVTNDKGTFMCDAVKLSTSSPIAPNETKLLSNTANGKACGQIKSVSMQYVDTCEYGRGSDCDQDDIYLHSYGLNWVK